MKGKLWYWGSYGAQDIKVGVVGFYKKTPECTGTQFAHGRHGAPAQLSRDRPDDAPQLQLKLTCVPFNNNRFNFQNTWAEKVRNARDACDRVRSRPPTARRPSSSDFGTFGWLTGPVAVLEGRRPARHQRQVARRRDVGAPRQQLRARLPRRLAARRAGRASRRRPACGAVRSRRRRSCARPTASTSSAATSCRRSSAAITRSSSATAGAARTRRASTIAAASSTRAITNGVANSADIWRDQYSESHLNTNAFYVQDTFTKNRLTLNLGFRYDMPGRRGAGGDGAGQPVLPDADAGDRLPGRGCRRGVEGLLAARRRHLRPQGRRQERRSRRRMRPTTARWARASSRASSPPPARCSSATRGPTPTATRFVQPSEVNTSVPFLSKSTAYDPANPTSTDVADPRRSERQERSHARVHRRLRPPDRLARWPSAPATSGASTISSSGTIATTGRARTTAR